MEILEKSWAAALKEELGKPYFKEITQFIETQTQLKKKVFPSHKDIFNAFKYCPFDNLKVVILGQDPYHGIGQAHGLAFSVPRGVALPPSLKNIFKELQEDIPQFQTPTSGSLSSWAAQGVFLLNTILTVNQSEPASHQNAGWQKFTDSVIQILNNKKNNLVFILWGSNAIQKKKFITNPSHLIIESAHPSPLSAYRGFFGSKPFSKTNAFLVERNMDPIHWQLPLDKELF